MKSWRCHRLDVCLGSLSCWKSPRRQRARTDGGISSPTPAAAPHQDAATTTFHCRHHACFSYPGLITPEYGVPVVFIEAGFFCAWALGIQWPTMSPDLNPIKHLRGILTLHPASRLQKRSFLFIRCLEGLKIMKVILLL